MLKTNNMQAYCAQIRGIEYRLFVINNIEMFLSLIFNYYSTWNFLLNFSFFSNLSSTFENN